MRLRLLALAAAALAVAGGLNAHAEKVQFDPAYNVVRVCDPVTKTQCVAVDVNGAIAVTGSGGGAGGTEYTEDAASAANPVGGMVMCRRRDTLTSAEVSADSHNIALNCTDKGQMHAFVAGSLTTLTTLTTVTNPVGIKGADGSAIAGNSNPVPVSDAGGSLTVDGTVSVTGVATAVKQPALGTAGAASADVITVQGIASMTPLKVDGSAVTQPVSIATAPALVAGSAIVGKFGIDQTTPGTTDSVTPKATEAHLGEVGGNQTTVQVAQTVTASSAYTSGNAIGGLMTIANAARVTGGSGLVQSVVANMKSAQTTQIDVFLFNSNPTGTTCTDKTAFALAAADFDKVLGVASLTSWFSAGTPSVGQAQNQAMPFALASGTSIYACAVTRSTPTYTSTSDPSFAFRILRN